MAKQDKKDSVKFQMFKLFAESDDFAEKTWNFSDEEVYDFAEFLMSLDDEEFYEAYCTLANTPIVPGRNEETSFFNQISWLYFDGQRVGDRMNSERIINIIIEKSQKEA